MKELKTYEAAGISHQDLRGLRGLAAAIIRQAFDDASAKTAPMIEITKNTIYPISGRLKLGEISGEDLIVYRKPDNMKNKSISKAKMRRDIVGKYNKNKINSFTMKEEYIVEDIENSIQKVLYLNNNPVGYIEGRNVYLASLETKNGKVKVYTQKLMKRKSQSSQLLSKAEQDEARGFILADSRYWQTALEFWCDVADLEWTYVVKLAKQQKWYPDHMKGKL